jgi:hypothetical protein
MLVLVECPAEERGMFSVGGDATFMGRVYRLLVKGASRTFRRTVRVKLWVALGRGLTYFLG